MPRPDLLKEKVKGDPPDSEVLNGNSPKLRRKKENSKNVKELSKPPTVNVDVPKNVVPDAKMLTTICLRNEPNLHKNVPRKNVYPRPKPPKRGTNDRGKRQRDVLLVQRKSLKLLWKI